MRVGKSIQKGNIAQTDTSHLGIPEGTTVQRPLPADSINGMVRYSNNRIEAYIRDTWTNLVTDRDLVTGTTTNTGTSSNPTIEAMSQVLNKIQRNVTGAIELQYINNDTPGVQTINGSTVLGFDVIRGKLTDTLPAFGGNSYVANGKVNTGQQTYSSGYGSTAPVVFEAIIDPFLFSGLDGTERANYAFKGFSVLYKYDFYIPYNNYGIPAGFTTFSPYWADGEEGTAKYGKFVLKAVLHSDSSTATVGIRWFCNLFKIKGFQTGNNVYIPPAAVPDSTVPSNITINLDSNTYNFSLKNYILTKYPLWNEATQPLNITVRVGRSVLISSMDESVPAFMLGNFTNTATTVKLINKGYIVGAGGAGGDGGDITTDDIPRTPQIGAPGKTGGVSMMLSYPISICNIEGHIFGTGGGGGGAPSNIIWDDVNLMKIYVGGSGGGGGAGGSDFNAGIGGTVSSKFSKTENRLVERTNERHGNNGQSGNIVTGGAGGTARALGRAGGYGGDTNVSGGASQPLPAEPARGYVVMYDQPTLGSTIRVGGTPFTFGSQITIGTSIADTLENLRMTLHANINTASYTVQNAPTIMYTKNGNQESTQGLFIEHKTVSDIGNTFIVEPGTGSGCRFLYESYLVLFPATITNGQTITVNNVTYTFVESVPGVNEVHIDTHDILTTISNLVQELNGSNNPLNSFGFYKTYTVSGNRGMWLEYRVIDLPDITQDFSISGGNGLSVSVQKLQPTLFGGNNVVNGAIGGAPGAAISGLNKITWIDSTGVVTTNKGDIQGIQQ
jgi:hypothetical protein